MFKLPRSRETFVFVKLVVDSSALRVRTYRPGNVFHAIQIRFLIFNGTAVTQSRSIDNVQRDSKYSIFHEFSPPPPSGKWIEKLSHSTGLEHRCGPGPPSTARQKNGSIFHSIESVGRGLCSRPFGVQDVIEHATESSVAIVSSVLFCSTLFPFEGGVDARISKIGISQN